VIVSGQNTTSVTVNAGIYSGSICVTADNLCASSNPVCLPVTINPDPATPAAVSGPDSLCPNTQSVVYYTNGAAYATSYFWSVPAGVSIVAGQGTNTLTVDFGSNAGLFSVIASNNCGQSTPSVKNTYLYAVPAIPVITLVGSDLVSSPAYAYQWYLNGVMIQGATSQTLTPTTNGYYSVTVFNLSGCVSSSVSYTYNLSSINENNDENLIKIYPNPAHDQFVIEAEFMGSEKISVVLLNTLGEVVMMIDEGFKGMTYHKTVNIEHLPYGVYYLRIINGDKAIVSKIIRN
jgi:hypothetical protein